ncbi:MAG: sensor domain-containing diguanylate cyclase, partial [Burkholderiaceae bacterium]
MRTRLSRGINLQGLILWLSVVAITFALLNSFYASYRVQRDILTSNTLESNRAYAVKTAAMADITMQDAVRALAFGAMALSEGGVTTINIRNEVERLQLQSYTFNSTGFITEDKVVLYTSPISLGLAGQRIDTPATQNAVTARQPTISQPFISITGRWIVTLSQPVFSRQGEFMGALVGSIYLHETNALHTMLAEHPHRDGSYLFVVDPSGKLLFHPDPKRVGDMVIDNPAVRAALGRGTGNMELTNTRGVQMLAGFAPMYSTSWGVIAQRPLAVTLNRQDELLWSTVRQTLPMLLVLLILIWWLSRLISRPLSQMAKVAQRMDTQQASEGISNVRAWYVEALQLKRALLEGLASIDVMISHLREENATDPLTGLLNRRGVDAVRAQLDVAGIPFGIVMTDIDFFKKVNDVYGHDAGDKILQQLASLMRHSSRAGDVLGRLGGEEFVMLLPNVSLEQTETVAERLRSMMEHAATLAGNVTLSAGVAHSPTNTRDSEQVLRLADEALYDAKHAGRN